MDEKFFNINQRFQELRLLVSENDLNLATRRLMDFASDFEIDKRLRNQVVFLRAKYNKSANKEENTKQEENEQLLRELLELLDSLEADILLRNAPKTDREKTFEQAKDDYWRSQYLIYDNEDQILAFEGKSVYKHYPSVGFSLSNIHLKLRLGEMTGIVGENGNGKTTMLRIAAGDLKIDEGTLRYPAFQVPDGDWYKIKQQIAFIPQHLKAWRGFLKDNLHFAAANHGIFGNANEEIVQFVLHRLGLTRYAECRWNEISSGYKLRFELAKALVWQPKLLILDEPLANLDINTKLLFLQDMRLLANSARNPMAILLSSQQLYEIESVVDNILFLKNGEPIYNGKVKDFEKNRNFNTFEIAGEFDRAALSQALIGLKDFTITDTGQAFLVEVNREVGSEMLLKMLLARPYKLSYFRDISQSTRKLFY